LKAQYVTGVTFSEGGGGHLLAANPARALL
jgi:hypothetical protein